MKKVVYSSRYRPKDCHIVSRKDGEPTNNLFFVFAAPAAAAAATAEAAPAKKEEKKEEPEEESDDDMGFGNIKKKLLFKIYETNNHFVLSFQLPHPTNIYIRLLRKKFNDYSSMY